MLNTFFAFLSTEAFNFLVNGFPSLSSLLWANYSGCYANKIIWMNRTLSAFVRLTENWNNKITAAVRFGRQKMNSRFLCCFVVGRELARHNFFIFQNNICPKFAAWLNNIFTETHENSSLIVYFMLNLILDLMNNLGEWCRFVAISIRLRKLT